MSKHSNKGPIDPFTYIGKVQRDDSGRVASMEVYYPTSSIKLADGDEFITFTTVIDLATPPDPLEL